MQREAYKTCPHDYMKRDLQREAYKAAFQQYKDANTNWKDVLLAYRADKIKEWNQDHDTEDRDKEAADVNTVVVGAGEDTEIVETTPPHKRAAVGGSDVVVERTDSEIITAALVRSPCPREVGHRPPCDDPDRVREGYEKSTIAGDDPKAFRDKYRFLPCGEAETNLRNIWAAMERAAHKTCPGDYTKLKTTFQQYKDANTNWKDILLAYRADKIKEWNQDYGIGPHESFDWAARAKSKADVTMDATTNKPSDVDMIAVDDLSQENPHDKEDFELTRDPPSYDSGTLPSEADAKTMMDKIEARTSRMLFTSRMPVLQEWLQANGKARKFQEADQECSLATFPECDEPVASDKKCPRAMTVEIYKKGANMFRDKYGFHPHGEFETELIRIWTKMERAAHKTCPSSRDHTKLKAAFQQYKDANTNWKDILLAYRADKTKEWNRAADVITVAAGVGENTMAAGVGEDIEQCKLIRQLYEDVVDWQSQRCISSIPCRHSLDEEERRLGCRLQHALIRQYRDPSLANVDTSLINRIRGVGAQEQPRAWIRKLYNDVIEWRSQRSTSSIPRRHFFGDDEERRLAFRLQRARTPSSRAKFTKVDEGFINSISDIISIRSQITFKKARESARKAKESWKTVKENFQLTIESMRKAKATESLQKVSRKRSEIRKAQSLWCVRLKAVKKFQEQNFRLPVRNKRTTKCEQGLANWLDKAKQRKDRALSSRPSERLLTNTEYVQLKELFDRQEVLDRKTLVSITRSQNARKKARESIQKAKRKLGDS